MHHVTTAVDMNAPVEVPRGVQRVDFVPSLKHLPAGARHNSRPLDKRSHDYGATIAVDLQVNKREGNFDLKSGTIVEFPAITVQHKGRSCGRLKCYKGHLK